MNKTEQDIKKVLTVVNARCGRDIAYQANMRMDQTGERAYMYYILTFFDEKIDKVFTNKYTNKDSIRKVNKQLYFTRKLDVYVYLAKLIEGGGWLES